MTQAIEIAGVRFDLDLPGAHPAVSERYAPFASRPGPPRYSIRFVSGRRPASVAPGRVVRRGARLFIEGAEALGSLDLASGTAELLAHEDGFAVDMLVRAALTLDVLSRRGCLLHASAVVLDDGAHVCAGRSGAGKTTLARLAPDALCDELCAIVPVRSGWRVYGSPWWWGRPGGAPLAAVHALAWDGEDLEPLGSAAALRHLAGNLALVVDDAATRAAAFDAAGRIARSVGFSRLRFRLDSDVAALLGAGSAA